MSGDKKIRDWNERYAADDYLFGTEPNDFLKNVSGNLPDNAQVLCLADGEGRNSVHLASLGHQVTAIDQSQVGLDKAAALAEQRKVSIETIVADLTHYDLGIESWDCIVSIFFHLPANHRDLIYPRIVAALKPGGLLILESYSPEQVSYGTGGPPVPEMMPTPKELSQHFAALDIIHLEQIEREVIEGFGHTGLASVVQLLAKR